MTRIVTVNVAQQVAPTPSTLQRKGAIVTQGGTNTPANTLTYLTQASDLAAIQSTTPSTALTELTQAATTFFAQGSSLGVYVLELGAGTADAGITALEAWITAHPNTVYAFLTSRELPSSYTNYASMGKLYAAPTSKTYFFNTLDSVADNKAAFAGIKSIFSLAEAPGLPGTEFSAAAAFRAVLAYNPSSTNLVTPTAYSFLYGVTPYPYQGNKAFLDGLEAANVNYVGTGAEGGISNAILRDGVTGDGEDFTYWYSVDWMQVNQDLALSNAIINGSNNPLAPLYYNQAGINTLQRVAVSTARRAISYGLALGTLKQTTLAAADFIQAYEDGAYDGQVVVNAEPFAAYSAENPNDYAAGQYNGLTLAYTPARGFKSIIFNVDVSNFVAA